MHLISFALRPSYRSTMLAAGNVICDAHFFSLLPEIDFKSIDHLHLISEMQPEDENIELFFENLGLRHFDKMPLQPNLCVAYGILIASLFFGVIFIYSAFLSKLIPDTGIFVIDFMKNDYYFCYLLPLMLLPTYIVVYINWLAMKFFKNN
jgi:hypothetical protein